MMDGHSRGCRFDRGRGHSAELFWQRRVCALFALWRIDCQRAATASPIAANDHAGGLAGASASGDCSEVVPLAVLDPQKAAPQQARHGSSGPNDFDQLGVTDRVSLLRYPHHDSRSVRARLNGSITALILPEGRRSGPNFSNPCSRAVNKINSISAFIPMIP